MPRNPFGASGRLLVRSSRTAPVRTGANRIVAVVPLQDTVTEPAGCHARPFQVRTPTEAGSACFASTTKTARRLPTELPHRTDTQSRGRAALIAGRSAVASWV